MTGCEKPILALPRPYFGGTITIDGTTSWSAGTATTNYTWAVSTVKDADNHNVTRWTLTKK